MESENSEEEETSTGGRGGGRFYSDHMMDIYENYSETNDCEDLERTSHRSNATR